MFENQKQVSRFFSRPVYFVWTGLFEKVNYLKKQLDYY